MILEDFSNDFIRYIEETNQLEVIAFEGTIFLGEGNMSHIETFYTKFIVVEGMEKVNNFPVQKMLETTKEDCAKPFGSGALS